MLCKILNFFVNTLTADDKYSLLNRGNLTQPIQILVSKKQNTFCQFLSEFMESKLNIEHPFKKDDPQTRCISEIPDSEKGH